MGTERSIRTMHFILAVLFAAATAAPALDPGLGALHWKVSTRDAKAQAYFDQGMKYVYAFNHEQAVRSFNEAVRRDPELAMGYWGAALALGPNINMDVDPDREKQAYDAVHAAAQHLGRASQKERDLVAALTKRYTNDPQADLKKLAADEVSGRRRRRRALRRVDHGPPSVEVLVARRQAVRGHRGGHRAVAARPRAQSQPPRREPLPHPPSRGLPPAGARRPRRAAPCRSSRRPPAISCTCRRTSIS